MTLILMAAIYGAKTDDAEMYHRVFDLPEYRVIQIKLNHVEIPEVQRIRIQAINRSAKVELPASRPGRRGKRSRQGICFHAFPSEAR